MTLTDLCNKFQTDVEALDEADLGHATQLAVLVRKLAFGATAYFADYPYGEVPAIIELTRIVLAWLKAEAEDTNDRQRRYARQQAVVNLLMLCEGLSRFHTGKRRGSDTATLRGQIGEALRGLIPE
jgi:hypothetical protein